MKRRPMKASKHAKSFHNKQKRRKAINTPGTLARGGIRL